MTMAVSQLDTLDDVLRLKCHKAIAAVQRTLDLYGCTACAPDHDVCIPYTCL